MMRSFLFRLCTIFLCLKMTGVLDLASASALAPWARRSSRIENPLKEDLNTKLEKTETNAEPHFQSNAEEPEPIKAPKVDSKNPGPFSLKQEDLQQDPLPKQNNAKFADKSGKPKTATVLDVYSTTLSANEVQLISGSLRRELKNTGRYQVYHRTEMKKALHQNLDIELTAYQKIDEYIREATRLYQDFKYASATALMKEAMHVIPNFDATPTVSKKISEAYLTQALIFQAEQREKDAEVSFLNAAALDPERQLDPAQYAPDVIAKFYQSKVSFQKTKEGSLKVKTIPSLAEVWVDGKMQGKTPLVLKDLPLGVQKITLLREGFDPWEKNVMIVMSTSGKPENELEVTLDRLGENVSLDALMGEMVSRKDHETQIAKLADIGKQLMSDAIFATRIEHSGSGWDLFIAEVDTETGKEISRGYAFLDNEMKGVDPAIHRVFQDMLSGKSPEKFTELLAVEGNGNRYRDAYQKKKPFYKKWPFYAIVGTLLAGAGGSAVYFLTRDPGHPSNASEAGKP